MSKETVFRIAVRQFSPFESAMQKIWDAYCEQSGCSLTAEMIPMDLHPLHKAIIEDEGLLKGEWDVAHINTDWIFEAYQHRALVNLTPYIQNNQPLDFPAGWSNSLLSMQKFGEEIVGLPFHDGPECLIYRKDLFEDPTEQENYLKEYGKPLQVPKTWDEFHQVAKFFHRPQNNLYGVVFAGFPDGHNTVFDFCLQLWSRGGALTNEEGLVDITSNAAVEGLDFYRKILKDENVIHPGSKKYESVQAGMAFARGEVAMMVNWFGFASMCEVYPESQVKGKVDVTTIPAAEGKNSASLNVYWLYAIGSGSKHKDVAYDFIRFATNISNDKLLTLEGGIGCRRSTWQDEEVNKVVPYYHKLEGLHEVAESLPQKSNWAEIARIIDEAVLSAIDTTIPSKDILFEAQKKIRLIDNVANKYHANTL